MQKMYLMAKEHYSELIHNINCSCFFIFLDYHPASFLTDIKDKAG